MTYLDAAREAVRRWHLGVPAPEADAADGSPVDGCAESIESLVVSAPRRLVTDEFRGELINHRDELVALASREDADAVSWRVEVMRGQLPPFPRPVPLLLARPDNPYVAGTCISCGDPVLAARCGPCREAVRQVLHRWDTKK
jgi:hypothetical protein